MDGTQGSAAEQASPERAPAQGLAAFYAARLRGPAEARAAVLRALAAGEPHLLGRVAELAGPALGMPRWTAFRLGLVAETLRAALRESSLACARAALPSRLERAMQVLVADTLITFTYELAADLPDRSGAVVRRLLPGVLGAGGSFAALAAEGGTDPDREASSFLGEALLEAARAESPAAPLDSALASCLRHAAALEPDGGPALPPRRGPLPEGLREALELWRSIAAARAARGRRSAAAARAAAGGESA